jgi:hypothetical protein
MVNTKKINIILLSVFVLGVSNCNSEGVRKATVWREENTIHLDS